MPRCGRLPFSTCARCGLSGCLGWFADRYATSTDDSPRKCDGIQQKKIGNLPTWKTILIKFNICVRFMKNPKKEFYVPPSTGGVPAFRKRNKSPGQFVVVVRPRRRIEGGRIDQKVLLRGRNGRSYDIQQSVEFSFAHRTLPS